MQKVLNDYSTRNSFKEIFYLMNALGGGFKYFLFSPLFAEDSQFA